MISDWKKEIAVAWFVQNETAKLDIKKRWTYFLPKVAATEQDLARAEDVLGYPLDIYYRKFLSFANGWRCFYQMVDLFGTEELTSPTSMQMAYLLLDEIVPEVLEKSQVTRSDLIPIAVSSTDTDLFVITRASCARPGMILWLAGYEIDRYATFDEYFLAMVDYNRLRLERFINENKSG